MVRRHHVQIAIATMALTLTASSSFAAFNGFYLGAAAGGSFATGNQHLNESTTSGISAVDSDGTVSPLASTIVPLNVASAMKKNSVIGELFAGYEYSCNRFYLGGEIFVNDSSYQMKNSVDTGINQNLFSNALQLVGSGDVDSKAKISSFQYGVTLRPGILITPTSLLFARIGTTIANRKYTVKDAESVNLIFNPTFFGEVIPNGAANTNLNLSKSKTNASLQVGGGLEQYFAKHWSVRMDYVYTYYGKLTVSGSNATTQTISFVDGGVITSINATGNNSVKLSDNAVTLGIAYHFDCV